MRALDKRDTYRGAGQLRAWLGKMLNHMLLDFMRAQKTKRKHLEIYARELTRRLSCGDATEHLDKLDRVFGIIEHLKPTFNSPKTVSAFLLEIGDWSREEIALALKMDLRAVHAAIDRVRKKLQAAWEDPATRAIRKSDQASVVLCAFASLEPPSFVAPKAIFACYLTAVGMDTQSVARALEISEADVHPAINEMTRFTDENIQEQVGHEEASR